jgi:hypothetical protein
MPRLVETANTLMDSRKFIALSHMWGDMTVSPPLRSIRSNYETMKNGVAPSSRLPMSGCQIYLDRFSMHHSGLS